VEYFKILIFPCIVPDGSCAVLWDMWVTNEWKRLISWGCYPVPLLVWGPFADLFFGPAASVVRKELGATGFVVETAEGWTTRSTGPFSTLSGMEKVAAAAIVADAHSRTKYYRCPVCLRVESVSPTAHSCTRGYTLLYSSVVLGHLRTRRPILVGTELESLAGSVL